MDYYEELGVRQDASVAEIQHAYKMLARVLHPDHQLDPNLKIVADREMQRLGEILSILVNPAARSEYDDRLTLRDGPRTSPAIRSVPARGPVRCSSSRKGLAAFTLRHWFGTLMGVFIVALSSWCFIHTGSTFADAELQHPPLTPEPAPPEPTSQLRAQPSRQNPSKPNPSVAAGPALRMPEPPQPTGSLREVHHASLPGIDVHFGAPALASIGAAWQDIANPGVADEKVCAPSICEGRAEQGRPAIQASTVPDPARPAPRQRPSKDPAVQSSLTGRWLYAPQPGDIGMHAGYSAIYIELVVAGHNGELSADYHARYRIPDRAVSPDVNFKMRGAKSSGTSAQFAWANSDNARGLAEITLRAPNALFITWWTTGFGRQPTLGSGTATLIRQQVP